MTLDELKVCLELRLRIISLPELDFVHMDFPEESSPIHFTEAKTWTLDVKSWEVSITSYIAFSEIAPSLEIQVSRETE